MATISQARAVPGAQLMGGPAAARAFASSVTRRHPELVYDFWDRALDPRSSIHAEWLGKTC
jgi:hypothetical protein